MKYYRLKESIDPTVIGKIYPQTEPYYPTNIEHPEYIFNAFKDFSKIDRNVIIPFAKLRKKSAKISDVMNCTGFGFSFRMLISDRLKTILENSNHLGCQFLPTKIYSFSGEEEFTYWLTNSFIFFPEYVDFKNSEIWLSRAVQTPKEKIYCDSFEQFEWEKKRHAPAPVQIGNFSINSGIVEYDFFAINEVTNIIAHCVSEDLKNKIEEAGCTGFEFVEA
jgi:hypothetical protein